MSDVGFASSPRVPLRFDLTGVEQEGDGEWDAFRLTRVRGVPALDDPKEECVMVERRSKTDGEWFKAILVYEKPCSLADLTVNCDVCVIPVTRSGGRIESITHLSLVV